jgi:tRNA 2-selenouridine synthase
MSILNLEAALAMKNVIFIDARSPGEFEESHIVGAYNWPILDNLERKTVGTIYKMSGKQEAVTEGINAVKDKLGDFFDQMIKLTEEYEHLILYCSRGGMRSDALYNFGTSIGIKNLYKLEGGYKAYRNYVISKTDDMLEKNPLNVIHGRTGTGKTLLLKALENLDISMIDLEDLAQNAGSVFGNIPYPNEAPSQKMFENLIFEKLRTMKKPIFVESESRRIGKITLTKGFHEAMKRGEHILIETAMSHRVEIITEFYLSALESGKIVDSLQYLRKHLGNEKVDEMITWANEKAYGKVIEMLIIDYYDPLYDYSIKQYDSYVMTINNDHVEKAAKQIEAYVNEGKHEK